MRTKQHTSSSVIHDVVASDNQRPLKPWLSTKLLWVICAGVLGAAAAIVFGRWALLTPISHGVVMQSPQRVANFTLTDHAGQAVSLDDFRGQYVLLNFGYTYCPDVCPLTLATLSETVKLLEADRHSVQVLFVTVDPARDTPERLAQYVAHFDSSFIGLTGTEEKVQAAATQFGVYYARSEPESSEPDSNAAYLVDHTATVLLIDPQGYLRVLFPYGITSQEMASDLSILIH